jgi:hypothetical protein
MGVWPQRCRRAASHFSRRCAASLQAGSMQPATSRNVPLSEHVEGVSKEEPGCRSASSLRARRPRAGVHPAPDPTAHPATRASLSRPGTRDRLDRGLRDAIAAGFVSAYTDRMLLLKGFSRDDVTHNPNINLLARWTPFACGCLGALGLVLRSPAYLWALGILTLIGAVSSRSFCDYLYQILLRPLTRLGEMPRHGAPRRFGCAIGAVLFVLSGAGFYVEHPLLSFVPALLIIPLAFGAAFTQWCFASALHRLITGKKADCC